MLVGAIAGGAFAGLGTAGLEGLDKVMAYGVTGGVTSVVGDGTMSDGPPVGFGNLRSSSALKESARTCVVDHYGIEDILERGAREAALSPVPKSWVNMRKGMGDASRWTSKLSALATHVPEIDFRLPARMLETPSGLRFLGRLIATRVTPVVGWGVAACDAGSIMWCTKTCMGDDTHQ